MEPEDYYVGEPLFCGIYESQIGNTLPNIYTATEQDVYLQSDDQIRSYIDLEYPPVYVPRNQLPQQFNYGNYESIKIPDLSEIANSGLDEMMIFTPTEDLIQPGLLVSPEILCSKTELNTYLKILNECDEPIVPKQKPQILKKIKAPPKPVSEVLKRKRELNRVASANCKRRKVENILQLQGTVKTMENSNSEIEQMIETLKREVYDLEYELSRHVNDKLCPIEFRGNKIVMK